MSFDVIMPQMGESITEAKDELKAAKIRYTDLTGTNGSTHIPVDVITAGLPDDEI